MKKPDIDDFGLTAKDKAALKKQLKELKALVAAIEDNKLNWLDWLLAGLVISIPIAILIFLFLR